MFTGVLGGFPAKEETLDRILKKGFKKVCIIPLLLVTGFHFIRDLTQEESSWQKTLERHHIEVSVISNGIGNLDDITRIFCRHIKEALDVIPL